MIALNLRDVPFSRYGSYLAISQVPAVGERAEGLCLRSVHGDAPYPGVLCRIDPIDGGLTVPFTVNAGPTSVRLETAAGYVELCLPSAGQLRLRGSGIGVRLSADGTRYGTAVFLPDGRWQVINDQCALIYSLIATVGSLSVEAPWQTTRFAYLRADFLPNAVGVFEGTLEELTGERQPHSSGDGAARARSDVEEEYRQWLEDIPAVTETYREGRELAAYILWSCVVAAEGHLRRPAVLMSKNRMARVWSWDHCFNALALAPARPDLAWDQFMTPFDQQDQSGVLPDWVNDRLHSWSFVKPPIHGWTLKRLMETPGLVTRGRLEEVYEPLSRWTRWWLTTRRSPIGDLPMYYHGNDCWDNATVFDRGVPVVSPDLAAFLAIQMETLADVATVLGRHAEVPAWRQQARVLVDGLVARLWRDQTFVARLANGDTAIDAYSLVLYMPIILGPRLPTSIVRSLVAALQDTGRFLTAHGLATESRNSPLYQSDGYWRGPIWAPSTLLIVDALREAGEHEFARQLARSFCDMALRSGMAENFDAVTGQGQCERAHTWTASVFLLLAWSLDTV